MNEARLRLFERDRLEYRFCQPRWADARRAIPATEVLAQLDGVDAARCKRLVLADGAPFDHPELERIVAGLAERGFTSFELVTDAPPLARAGILERLRGQGLSRLLVVMGGASAAAHEEVLAAPGSFAAAMEGLAAAIGTVPTYVVVPVVRRNDAEVMPLLEALLERPARPRGFLLALPEARHVRAAERVQLLLPYARLAELSGHVFRRAERALLEHGFLDARGIPPCAAGAHLDRYASIFHERIMFLRHAREDRFQRVAACETCSVNQTCPGIEAEYLESFGAGDLAPVPLSVSAGWRLRKHWTLEQRDFKHLSPFENQRRAEKRMALVRVNGHCNMSCSFCFVDRTVPDYDTGDLCAEIEGLIKRGGVNHLVLSGGEPTLHPALPELVAYARELGARDVELHTNGVRAADLDYARTLVAAGVTEATTSLHSADPATSDKITGLPEAFWKTVRGVQNFRDLGITTKIALVITELNYRELLRTMRFYKEQFQPAQGDLSVCVAFVQPISDLVFKWIIPRFTDVKPYLKEALDYALANGIGFGGMLGQGGLPPCMLDGDMRYYEMNLRNIYKSADSDQDFYKAPRCKDCSFDPYCVGVRRDYVAQYGDDEIRPFQAEIRVPEVDPKRPAHLVESGRGRADLVQIGAARR